MKLTESNAALVNISDDFVFLRKSPYKHRGYPGMTSVFVNSKDKTEKVILYSNHNNTLTSVTFRKSGVGSDGIIYRSESGLPSYSRFWSSGEKRLEVFTNTSGQVSRLPSEGPAIIKYSQKKHIATEIFVVDGIAVSQKDYKSCSDQEVNFKFTVSHPQARKNIDD